MLWYFFFLLAFMLLLSYEIAFIRHCQLIIWLWLVSLGEFMHWVDSQQKDTHMGKVSSWLFHLCFSETSQGSRPAQRLCGIRSILQKMKFQTLTSQTCSTQHLGLDIVVAANFTLSLNLFFVNLSVSGSSCWGILPHQRVQGYANHLESIGRYHCALWVWRQGQMCRDGNAFMGISHCNLASIKGHMHQGLNWGWQFIFSINTFRG